VRPHLQVILVECHRQEVVSAELRALSRQFLDNRMDKHLEAKCLRTFHTKIYHKEIRHSVELVRKQVLHFHPNKLELKLQLKEMVSLKVEVFGGLHHRQHVLRLVTPLSILSPAFELQVARDRHLVKI
jgi:hypothetical protein